MSKEITMEANNVERMRKCIDNLIQMVCSQCRYKCNGKLCSGVAEARSVLALPPRNCDVGTAEEQDARFVTWRYSKPLRTEFGLDALAWAQMPYAPTEADA